jgi:NADH-quinone oxidoreductase subunit J
MTPWYVAAAIAAAGLVMVLRPGRVALRRAGAVIGLAGFALLMGFGLRLAGASATSASTPLALAVATVGVIGAVRVITHTRPVFAAIYFVLTVISAAAIFLMLEAEFLAFALVIVYAGAILITYMFVLMLAHQSPEDEIGRIGAEDYDRVPREPLVAVFLGFFLLAALGSVVERVPPMTADAAPSAAIRTTDSHVQAQQRLPRMQAADGVPAERPDNVHVVGLDLVARYPASLELAGVILLMAMFGAVVLARRQIELGEDERRKAAGMGGMVLDLPENERGAA